MIPVSSEVCTGVINEGEFLLSVVGKNLSLVNTALVDPGLERRIALITGEKFSITFPFTI